MTISEKSAYLKGLAEGMKLDRETTEGKLISELIDLVADISKTVETIDNDVCEIYDYVDEIDSDLCDLEEYCYDDDEDFEDDDDEYEYGEYEDCDGECEGCSGCDDLEDDEDEDVFDLTEEGMRSIVCDSCGDVVCYDETLDPKEITCPGCGKPVVKAEEE